MTVVCHGVLVEVRGQLVEMDSLLLYGSGNKLRLLGLMQVPLLVESSCQPYWCFDTGFHVAQAGLDADLEPLNFLPLPAMGGIIRMYHPIQCNMLSFNLQTGKETKQSKTGLLG